MKLALFGFGGHAREVAAQINSPVTFFTDKEFFDENTYNISQFDPTEFTLMIAIGDSNKRKEIVDKLPKETKFFTFIHPTAQIMGKDVEIGVGSFIGANSILTTNIKIGQHAVLNRAVHIGHDCVIGDYFSAMPGAIVSGNVLIGNNCYLGTNSSIKEKTEITSNVIVGSNATVVNNIGVGGIYVGVPAKILIK
jgi:sugar O-acyltransferase (sialic acid O-acetyltransferase NeuD family)